MLTESRHLAGACSNSTLIHHVRRALRHNASSGRAVVTALALTAAASAHADYFPPEVALESLLPENGGDGRIGTVLFGSERNDEVGQGVGEAGDINGDGIDDIIIGSLDPDNTGTSYVLFGSATPLGADLELETLRAANGGDGTRGFVIDGPTDGDLTGASVAGVGDVNGDGSDDLLIGGRPYSFILFGADSFPPEVALDDLFAQSGGDGSAGVVLDVPGTDTATEVSAAGDFNGDGLADMLVGAWLADPVQQDEGTTYVLFGREDFPAEVAMADLRSVNGGDGTLGVVIDGRRAFDRLGLAVRSLGDFNGDGSDDIAIASPANDANGDDNIGEVYVLYGRAEGGFAAELDLDGLLPENDGDGSAGSVLTWSGRLFDNPVLGLNLGAGDVNGDGHADLLVGASRADVPGLNEGEAYVLFGSDVPLGATLDLTDLLPGNGGDGTRGYALRGTVPGRGMAEGAAIAGDINGDGVDDILLSAPYSTAGGALNPRGESFLIFGTPAPVTSPIFIGEAITSLDLGVRFAGIRELDFSGKRLSPVGDFNADGIADFAIGAERAGPQGQGEAGEVYLIYGRQVEVATTVEGADVTIGLCRNQTNPQTVLVPRPGAAPSTRLACESQGLTASPGDTVTIGARGTYVGGALRGDVDVIDVADVTCNNITQGVVRTTGADAGGDWACTATDLPLTAGDSVLVVINGAVP